MVLESELSACEETPLHVRDYRNCGLCAALTPFYTTVREQIASKRTNIEERKRNLAMLKTPVPPSSAEHAASPTRLLASLTHTHIALARTRRVLIGELLQVFDIHPTTTPPTSSISHSRALSTSTLGLSLPNAPIEYSIFTLLLPVPGNVPHLPSEHITAVLHMTLHFVQLLTFYLGVKLPFEVVWEEGAGAKEGVGRAWIRAGKGGDLGGWAR